MRKLSMTEWIAVAAALILVGSFALPGWFGFFLGQSQAPTIASSTADSVLPVTTQNNVGQNISTIAGLEIYDTTLGTGAAVINGSQATVNYTGTLTDGTVFDSNTNPQFGHVSPFPFTVGAGQVIKGWDQGLIGMKVGGTRHLVISPALGYGSTANGPIPANSTLIFDVTLLGVK
ncbi:MAG TPA: FKBP-type peptidyl-prolyl cis-trans isomerase [Candidatus Paceibacterota bacterium]|nr:FKBP-type peptidyl-prolyl cis-trans isomerase [Candidatus Paceibacterota bacterium]